MIVGSEMIEKAARILEPLAWAALGTGDTLAYKNRRTSSLRKARAVLQALMKPTFAMKMAGAEAITAEHMKAMANYDAADDAWQAMIRAALEEGESK